MKGSGSYEEIKERISFDVMRRGREEKREMDERDSLATEFETETESTTSLRHRLRLPTS